MIHFLILPANSGKTPPQTKHPPAPSPVLMGQGQLSCCDLLPSRAREVSLILARARGLCEAPISTETGVKGAVSLGLLGGGGRFCPPVGGHNA